MTVVRLFPRHLGQGRPAPDTVKAVTGVLVETPLVDCPLADPRRHEQAAREVFAVSRALAGLADVAYRRGPCDLHPDNQTLVTVTELDRARQASCADARVSVRHRHGARLARWHLEDTPPGHLEIWLETPLDTQVKTWATVADRMPARHAWWTRTLGHWLARRGLPWQWAYQAQQWRPGSPAPDTHTNNGVDPATWRAYETVLIDVAHAWLTDAGMCGPTPITARRGRRAALETRARWFVRTQAQLSSPNGDTVGRVHCAGDAPQVGAVDHAAEPPTRTPADEGTFSGLAALLTALAAALDISGHP
ncbi:hypothetical protein ACFY4C_39340 [Actinomadura viridis]|uniref:hypothetical protein n=1 Tax=Actinomadura viridis TaxID=58110 RepID=UPI0036C11760